MAEIEDLDQKLIFKLPLMPVTVNKMYFTNLRGRGRSRIPTSQHKDFKTKMIPIIRDAIKKQKWHSEQGDTFTVNVKYYWKDKKKRDLDNFLKALLDTMTEAGIYEDDSLIIRIIAEKYIKPKEAPCVMVEVVKMG